MAPNTAPIFGDTPNVGGCQITAVNTKSDGSGTIGTDLFKVWTAGVDGGWLSKVRAFNTATTAGSATAATTVRIFLSSKSSGSTTGADTFLIGELGMPVVTADATTTPTNPQELPLNIAVPAGWTVLASMHVSLAANTQLQAVAIGTDY